MNNVSKLKGTAVFVKPKLCWKDRLIEKELLHARFEKVKKCADRSLFRISDFILFYIASPVDVFDIDKLMMIINTISDNSLPKSGPEWLVNPKICLLNVRGLTTIANWSRLLDYLITNQTELTLITETWWDHTFDDNLASVFGQYTVSGRPDRCNGPHGGVIALKTVSSSMNFSKIQLDDCFNFACAFVLYSRNVSPVLLLLFYLPPSSSRYSVSAKELSACIDRLLGSFISEHSKSEPHFCVLGDFNLPKSKWKTLSSSIDYELHVFDFLSNHFLTPIIINTPTHIAENVLDNILVSNRSLFNLILVDSGANISDHYPINFEFNISE